MSSPHSPPAPVASASEGATGPGTSRHPAAGVALTLIALSTLLSMSVWFSASFVVPQLRVEWGLSADQSSLLTIAVQVGFVIGALSSAATGAADVLRPKTMICIGALGAAAANALLLGADGLGVAVIARFGTGFFLAAVYPPALKEASTWFRAGRGRALGVMIGALTVGSALPHLVNVFGGLRWTVVIAATSILTVLGGMVILLVRGHGPYPFERRPFSVRAAFASLRNREVVLANVGYVGHMWELYAMWAWIAALIATLPAVRTMENPGITASFLAFACIGVGAVGCLVGGILGDRWGRPRSALMSLACSGGSAAVLALWYPRLPFAAVLAVCAFWGFWVIADSAQFSALVTERAAPAYVGGALSLQLAAGYTTTAASLWLVPYLAATAGWQWALGALVIGPVIGAVAMTILIRHDSRSREGRPTDLR